MEKEKEFGCENEVVLSQGETDEKNLQYLSPLSKIKIVLSNITVEPLLVCIVFPGLMNVLTTQNMYLEKSCRVNLVLDEKICDALTTRNDSFPGYKVHEATCQIYAANMSIWKNIVESLFTATLLLFLGSWSDRHQKRKRCVMNSLLGEACYVTTCLLSAYFFYELPLQVVMYGEALPTLFSGGWHAMFLGVYSYISSITTEETRTVRIGAVHTLYSISFCMGISLSGVVFQNLGFSGVYSLSLSIYFCGYIYGTFFVKDICELQKEAKQEIGNETKKNFFVDFYNVKHVLKTLRIVFKKGEGSRRTKICLILILGLLVLGPTAGELNMGYFYARYKYGWSSIQYSIFYTLQYIISTLGAIFALTFFSKALKLDDAILGIIAAMSKLCASFIYAFAPNTIIFYLAVFADMFNTVAFISMRSIISKFVPPEELGAVNSSVGCIEAFLQLIWGPIYSKTYTATLTVFPGAFYLVGAGISVVEICIFLWLYSDNRRNQREISTLKSQKEALMENYREMNSTDHSSLTKRISIVNVQG